MHECLTLLLACANFAFNGAIDSHEGFFAAGPMEMRGKKVYLLFGVALIALLLVVGALYEVVAAANDAKQPPPGRLVDVGGFRLHILCTGKQGAPAVVLDAGLGDSSLVWASVQEQLSPHVRVCSFDRAGIPATAPRTPHAAVEELYALLQNAGEPPPYVLVGHSAGVNYVRLYAHAYPKTVKGLVLVEPPLLQEASPGLVTTVSAIRLGIGALARVGGVRLLAKAGQMGILYGGSQPPPSIAEHAAFLYRPQSIAASVQETRALPAIVQHMNQAARPHAWNDWPVTIIAAQQGAEPKPELTAALAGLAQLSSRGKVVTVRGSHSVQFEHPEKIAEAILEVVRSDKWIQP
jgi:pimeloyl-ACP methyl ester carboxylesterase